MNRWFYALCFMIVLAPQAHCGDSNIASTSVTLAANTVTLCAPARTGRTTVALSDPGDSDVRVGSSSMGVTGGVALSPTGSNEPVQFKFSGALYCISSVSTIVKVMEIF